MLKCLKHTKEFCMMAGAKMLSTRTNQTKPPVVENSASQRKHDGPTCPWSRWSERFQDFHRVRFPEDFSKIIYRSDIFHWSSLSASIYWVAPASGINIVHSKIKETIIPTFRMEKTILSRIMIIPNYLKQYVGLGSRYVEKTGHPQYMSTVSFLRSWAPARHQSKTFAPTF
jgi:hypothetical protein